MVFIFYKFLFFLSDFLEIQRKSFYLFLNELLSQEFTKIQPLWFRQNPVYKTGHSFGTSRKRHLPQGGVPSAPAGLHFAKGQGGSPRASDFSSDPRLPQSRSQPTEDSSAGLLLEARKPSTERPAWTPDPQVPGGPMGTVSKRARAPRRGEVLQPRKSQRSYPVAKRSQISKQKLPASGQPLSFRPSSMGSSVQDARPQEGRSVQTGRAPREPAQEMRQYNILPPNNQHIVDFSYKTLTNINEIYPQNWASREERDESTIQKIPPITANDRITTIYFLSQNYKFIKPTLNIEESILFSKTYCCNFYMPVKLLDHSTNFTEMKWIFLGTLPLLTRRGHFIINGTPRIILNQIIRSSGLYFHKETTEEKKNSRLFYAEIISKSGPWVRLEVDSKKKIWVSFQQIGRSRISLSHFFQNFYQKYLDHHIFLNEKKKKLNFHAILLNEFFLGGSRSFKESKNQLANGRSKLSSPTGNHGPEELKASSISPSRNDRPMGAPPRPDGGPEALDSFPEKKKSRHHGHSFIGKSFDQKHSFYFKFQKLWPKFKQFKIYSDDLSQNIYLLFSSKKYQIFNWSIFIYLKLKFSQKFTYPGFGFPKKRIQNHQWLKKTRPTHEVFDENEERGNEILQSPGRAGTTVDVPFGWSPSNPSSLLGKSHLRQSQATSIFKETSSDPQTRSKLGLDILFASSYKNTGTLGGFHLDRSGRIRLNKRLGLSLKTLTLTPIDFLAISDILYRLVQGGDPIDNSNPGQSPCAPLDDIDDLKNRRLKTIGELLQNQLARGIQRLQKTFENTVQKDWIKFLNYQTYNSSLSFLNSFNLNRKKSRILLERSFTYHFGPEGPILPSKSFLMYKSSPKILDPILKYYLDKGKMAQGSSVSLDRASSAWFPSTALASTAQEASSPKALGPDPGGPGQRPDFLKKGTGLVHSTQKTNTFDLLSYQNIFQKHILEKRNFYLQQIGIYSKNRKGDQPLFGYRLQFLTSRISQKQLYSLLTKFNFKRNFVWKELLLYQKKTINGVHFTDQFYEKLAVFPGQLSAFRPSALQLSGSGTGGPSAKIIPAPIYYTSKEPQPIKNLWLSRPSARPQKGVAPRPEELKTSPVFFSTSILSIVNSLPINSTFKEFFHSHQLSQFLDQSNPLAEITHKRRLSCLGSGGITRETAGMEIRGIHFSHYGRICPIETPEGKNAGLVNSLTTTVNVNSQGFLETPYIEVYKQHSQNQKKLLFFSVEDQEIKNVFFNPKLPKFRNISVGIIKPQTQNFYKLGLQALDLVAFNPQQFLSIATTCIPFIEHDDANRALMGSNMQRQALPLINLEQPIVTTVNAFRVLSDLKDIPTTSESGMVIYVSQQKISYYPLKKKKNLPHHFVGKILCGHANLLAGSPVKNSRVHRLILPAGRAAGDAGLGTCFSQEDSHLTFAFGEDHILGGDVLSKCNPVGERRFPGYIVSQNQQAPILPLRFQRRSSQFRKDILPLKLTVWNRSMSKQFFIQRFKNFNIDLKIQYNYKIFRIFFP